MRPIRIPEWVSRFGRVIIAASIGVLFALWTVFGGYSGLEGTTINARFRLRNWLYPWDDPPDNIVFVDINDAALAAFTDDVTDFPIRWPWPRSQWAFLHKWFRELGIHPAAMVYDIIFDLADDAEVRRMGYTIETEEARPGTSCDEFFQQQLEREDDVPTFLAALFTPQSPTPFTREDYRRRYESTDRFQWLEPPDSLKRFGIPYDPDIHGKAYHARDVSIPWDSRWWAKHAGTPPERLEELEFMGKVSSLLEPAEGVGTTTMNPEEDGITRWAPLFIEYDGILYPSLPLQVVLHLLGTPLETVRFEENAVIVPREEGSDIRIPVDKWKRILLNFRYKRPAGKEDYATAGFVYVNFWQLFDGLLALKEGREPVFHPRALDGKTLVVGSSAEGTYDLRAIPIAQRFPAVGTIGTIVRTILQEDFLHPAPPWVDALWIIGGTFLVGVLGLFFAPVQHALATIVLASAHAVSSFVLFAKAGVIVDFSHVAFAEIMAYAVVTVTQYFQVSSLFGRYITPEVRRFLMSNNSALELGGQETEVSILFSDLKGFTSMSEKMTAPQVISALNEYFGPMFRIIIDEHHGTLDKLIGDAIMAYFGHPRPTDDHPLQAVSAAVQMQRRLGELRQKWEKEGKPLIRMRIGVNTGTVVAGNMGDAGRTDYSIIGDNVNLASRLESNAPVDGVLISETTYERTKDRFVFKEREPILVKGKEKPVKVYEVVGFK